MANETKQDTGGSQRALNSTNFHYSDLSSPKKTIWGDYFLDLFHGMPGTAHKVAAASAQANVQSEREVETKPGTKFEDVVQRITSVRNAVSDRPTGNFHRKFFANETFRGSVSDVSNGKFIAVIKDGSGDSYEYIFSDEELPDQQRKDVCLGAPLVVHVGHEYRGSTKMNVVKIFLTNYNVDQEARNRIVSRKVAAWKF